MKPNPPGRIAPTKIVWLSGLLPLWLASVATAQTPCEAAEAFPTRNEICSARCWEEGSPEEQVRAAEANHADELRESCEAQEAAEETEEARRRQREARELRRPLHTLTRARAEWDVLHSLHHLPGWRRRDAGAVTCADGRINRTRFRCWFRWIHGTSCNVGRGQDWVVHHTGRGIWTRSRLRFKLGWGYVNRGVVHCPFWR